MRSTRGARTEARSARTVAAAVLVALVAVTLVVGGSASGADTPVRTLPGANFYPRVIELAHAGARDGELVASTDDGRVGRIWRSTDDGATFEFVGEIDPGPDAVGLCCIELFELSVAMGALPAGTLLWAGSVTTQVGPPRHMALRVWRSEDHGATWAPTAPCATSSTGGLWEPELHVTDDGELACIYSDETDPDHSQKLVQVLSSDGGATWSAPEEVVALDVRVQRPGMATTARLPDGTWVMTYEVCVAHPDCGIRLRRSDDGRHWGPVDDPGQRVAAADGSYLAHTPVISWTPAGGGTLILSGQQLFDADGSLATGNGRTLFVDHHGGAGPWTPIDAPVPVEGPIEGWCPNYSSPVLDVGGDGTLLELASRWEGTTCVTSYATRAVDLAPPPTSTTTTTTPTTTDLTTSTSAAASTPAEQGSATPSASAATAVTAAPRLTG